MTNADAWPGDFYALRYTLPTEDQALLADLRTLMIDQVAPVINDHWTRASFPHELVPEIAKLGIVGVSYKGYGFRGRSALLEGFIALEVGRTDPSMATFLGVHGGLCAASIYLCGSEEQRQRWLPAMARLEKIGSFGLTEPEVGSAAAGGLQTTARRDGGNWVLNGRKRWIGNASFADVNVIWARDVTDNQVKGFVVEKRTPGYSTEVMQDKIALRVVQNAMITLDDCRIPDENKLTNANSFADTAKVLRLTRAYVAWQATGCALGAFEHALAYAKRREQFGRPIGGFQLVQDLLVRMLSGITTSMTLCHRLSALIDEGGCSEEQASLAKAYCTSSARETVGLARELLGGNGILLEEQVGRFVADAEAIYSYEGTREINTLIVGRALTGTSAFV
ncbi:acyl-CoA dehydrogenase family protein [Leisingera sp. NJS204]|uniref:acyl-CoA dehydrogenase family protein n=1 Tax=Leisingera sp. NJS204 TaxID=2508307 RepID=UPI0010137DBE|nr:acyl-CoA dehydrogenase family protein [Leisingera sp. NJS204]QAX30753.1 acyl-CoA dehydrogenase [Leisingera sp. NJS204]